MDMRLFEMKLVNHKMFKEIKDGFSENPSGKLRNLLDMRDDVVYVWNAKENCLLSLNLKQLEEHGEEAIYQKLHFLTPPSFAVERVMTSVCGSRVCVWGSRGVTIAELPSRWGRSGLFDSGKQTVLCKSAPLDERFLYTLGDVRRVHWHPNSLSHVLVLVSDNTIRLYDIAPRSGPKQVKVFTIGPKPSSLLAGKTILDSLGDTAVDFTPSPDGDQLLILRGDGEVYMLQCDLESKSSPHPKLTGPLAIYPPADDNYGSESCSILALGGGDVPILVIIATCSASIYHCLLLPNNNETESSDGDSHALYVLETVELNIVLNSEDDALQYSYPVHLNQCSGSTYACVHAGGAHTVSLPALASLAHYAQADDVDAESVVASLCSRPSVSRYVVHTGGAQAPCPPVGAVVSHAPLPTLLLLCADGEMIARSLEPYDLEEQLYKEIQLKNPALEQDELRSMIKERQKLTFTAIIQEILSREVSQPILHTDKRTEPSPKECLETLSSACVRLRGEYVRRHARAAHALRDKLRAASALAQQQRAWLRALHKEIEDVQLQSVVLKEKCLIAEKHQEDIKYRCSEVIRGLRANSRATPAERQLLAELQGYKRCRERFADQILQLKQHSKQNAEQIKKWQEEYKKKDAALGKTHSDSILSILQQQSLQMSTLIEETKLLKDQLSIV